MPFDSFHVFFYSAARHHNLMITAKAFYLEIRADPQSLPGKGPAWMLFFHRQNITDPNIHYPLSIIQYTVSINRTTDTFRTTY